MGYNHKPHICVESDRFSDPQRESCFTKNETNPLLQVIPIDKYPQRIHSLRTNSLGIYIYLKLQS